MDGLTFLKRLMTRHSLPVIVCSSVAERGTATALQREFPDVAFNDFEGWAKMQDWNVLLQSA